MTFFQDLPHPPERPRPSRHVMPLWLGPPAANGQGGSGDEDQLTGSARLWLWPLPEDGDLRLVVQWKEAGMQEQSVVLDGDQIAAAARTVQQY